MDWCRRRWRRARLRSRCPRTTLAADPTPKRPTSPAPHAQLTDEEGVVELAVVEQHVRVSVSAVTESDRLPEALADRFRLVLGRAPRWPCTARMTDPGPYAPRDSAALRPSGALRRVAVPRTHEGANFRRSRPISGMSSHARRSVNHDAAAPCPELTPDRTHSPMTNRTTPPVVDGPLQQEEGRSLGGFAGNGQQPSAAS